MIFLSGSIVGVEGVLLLLFFFEITIEIFLINKWGPLMIRLLWGRGIVGVGD